MVGDIAEDLSELSLNATKAENRVAGEEEALQALRELIGKTMLVECMDHRWIGVPLRWPAAG